MGVRTDNFENRNNLRLNDRVEREIKAELSALGQNVDSFYEVKQDSIDFKEDVVEQYLVKLRDEVKDMDTKDAWQHLASKENKAAWIMAVQIALESLGYEIGKIDGILGNETKNGVLRFQRQCKLKGQEGFPGKETITKLCEALEMPGQFAAKLKFRPDGTSTAKSDSNSDKSKGLDTGAESSDANKSTQDPEVGKADAVDTLVQPSEGSETIGLDEKYGKDLQLFIPEVQKLVKGEKISVGGEDYNIWVKNFVVGGKREGDNIIGGEIKVCAGPSEINYVMGLSTGDLLDKDGNFDSQSFKDVLFPKVKENLESQIKAQKVMEKLKEKRKRGYSMEELVDDPKKRTNANYLRYFSETDSKTKSVTFDDISRDEDYINFYLDNDGRNNKPYNKLRVKYTELADENGNFDENRLIIYLKKKIKEIVETNFGS